jgi:hypothetical protein
VTQYVTVEIFTDCYEVWRIDNHGVKPVQTNIRTREKAQRAREIWENREEARQPDKHVMNVSPNQPARVDGHRSSESEERRGMGEWRLVETAPHATWVLLGWWDEGEWNSATGFASHGWRRGGISTMSRHGQATHWMPLPLGPPYWSKIT